MGGGGGGLVCASDWPGCGVENVSMKCTAEKITKPRRLDVLITAQGARYCVMTVARSRSLARPALGFNWHSNCRILMRCGIR